MKFLSALTVLASLSAGLVSAYPTGRPSGLSARNADGFESFAVDNAVLGDVTAEAPEKRAPSPAKPAGGKPAGGKPAAGAGATTGGSGGSRSPSPEPEGDGLLIYRNVLTPVHTYSREGGVDHSKLDALMKKLGGNHVEVIVGNTKLGWKAWDIAFSNPNWIKTSPNGDGEAVAVSSRKVTAAAGTKMGVAKTIKALDSVRARGNKINESHGKKYNVDTYNCDTFATELIANLKTV